MYAAACAAALSPALAGPPYVSDDPEPTDYRKFEIYAFTEGVAGRAGTDGSSGIDFNYGAAPDLQMTAVLPVAYDANTMGVGNVELAVKYRFAHQADIGWDIAAFPRVILPSISRDIGDKHISVLLPLWAEKDWGDWSTFGGGGCVLSRGGRSQDYCMAGWALTRAMTPALHIGAEIVHQGADSKGGHVSTAVGAGATYDLSETYHLLAYWGPSLENASDNGRYDWYAAVLFTF
jgi:outer membrane putative beta-barrel porin/alpha-amylase